MNAAWLFSLKIMCPRVAYQITYIITNIIYVADVEARREGRKEL
jgi:hypothetical protein